MAYKLPPPIIYKYTSSDTAEKILSSNTLWFSNPDDFNDPFDCHEALMDWSVDKSGIQEAINRGFPNASRNVRREKLMEFLKNPEIVSDAFRHTYEDARNKIGVCCFSKNYNNLLMWSHYSDKHQGLCIGFDIAANGDKYFIQEVNYPKKIEPKKFFSDQRDEALKHLLLTKSHYWKYEEEVRGISMDFQGAIKIQPKCVKKIIFGYRSNDSFIHKILNILTDNHPHIKIYQRMELDKDNFGLKVSGSRLISSDNL